MGDYALEWFQLHTTKQNAAVDRFVWYGVGKADGHLMDWRGCNFHHGRIRYDAPDGGFDVLAPVFDDPEQAANWLVENLPLVHSIQRGHHAGTHGCSKGCDDRSRGEPLWDATVTDAHHGTPGKRTSQTLDKWLEAF